MEKASAGQGARHRPLPQLRSVRSLPARFADADEDPGLHKRWRDDEVAYTVSSNVTAAAGGGVGITDAHDMNGSRKKQKMGSYDCKERTAHIGKLEDRSRNQARIKRSVDDVDDTTQSMVALGVVDLTTEEEGMEPVRGIGAAPRKRYRGRYEAETILDRHTGIVPGINALDAAMEHSQEEGPEGDIEYHETNMLLGALHRARETRLGRCTSRPPSSPRAMDFADTEASPGPSTTSPLRTLLLPSSLPASAGRNVGVNGYVQPFQHKHALLYQQRLLLEQEREQERELGEQKQGMSMGEPISLTPGTRASDNADDPMEEW
jgi:hypothetical protein